MEPIKANIGTSDNLANLKNWQDMFGELAKGYIDPAEPRKLEEGQSWGAGIGKLVHKYAFDMPASIVVNAAKLFDKGSKDPLSVAPLEYTATVADALLAATPGGGTGVANIGKRDALKSLGRSGANLAKHASSLSRSYWGKDHPVYRSYLRSLYDKVKDSVLTARDLPQVELDKIRSIAWTPRAKQGEFGYYSPATKDVRLTQILLKDENSKEVADTLFHEMTHARQYNPDKSISEMVKARALRMASNEFDYESRPIEQLARHTAMAMTNTDLPFEEAYMQTLNSYLRNAKAYKDMYTTGSDRLAPDAGQWSKLAPHLREGLELAKKIPIAKKQISRLSKIAAKADEIEASLRGKPGDPNKAFNLMQKANRLRKRANQQQVQYYKILQEFGIE